MAVDYGALKKGGFMRQKQKNNFSLRLQVVGGTLTAENGAMGYYRGLSTQGYTVTAEDSEGYVIMRFDFAYITNGQGAQNFNFTKMTGLRIDLIGLQSATVAYVKSIKK